MADFILKQSQHLKNNFWGTLYLWQNQRYLWLIGACSALILELIAIFFFQGYLGLPPCEKCVYIRLSIFVIFLGMVIAFVYPRSRILKIIAYILITWAIIQGLLWSIELHTITKEVENSGISPCTFTLVHFPFGLPLDDWFPSIFMPTGLCGEETWRLFSLNMAQYMIVIYFIYFILLGLFLLSILFKKRFNK